MPITFTDGFETYAAASGTNGPDHNWFNAYSYPQGGYTGLSGTTPYGSGVSLQLYRNASSTYMRKQLTVTGNDVNNVTIGFHLSSTTNSDWNLFEVMNSSQGIIFGLGNVTLNGVRVIEMYYNGVNYALPWLAKDTAWHHYEVQIGTIGVRVYQDGQPLPIFSNDTPAASNPYYSRFRTLSADNNYLRFDNYYEANDINRYGVMREDKFTNATDVQTIDVINVGGTSVANALSTGSISSTSVYAQAQQNNSLHLMKYTIPVGCVSYNYSMGYRNNAPAPVKIVFIEGETIENYREITTPAYQTSALKYLHFNNRYSDLVQDGNQTDVNGEYHLFGFYTVEDE